MTSAAVDGRRMAPGTRDPSAALDNRAMDWRSFARRFAFVLLALAPPVLVVVAALWEVREEEAAWDGRRSTTSAARISVSDVT